jgi:hypothetical protein
MKRSGFALAAVITAWPALAQAEVDEFGSYGRSRYDAESPQQVAVELRFGRYVPNADDGLSGTPYQDVFGDDNRYYGGLEVDWQLLRIPYFGTLSPGIGGGYTRSGATARFESDGRESGDTTRLHIFPFYLVGVLRADVIARETPVPLVPYGKLGLGVALWRVTDGNGTASSDGVSGRGLSYGPQFMLGAMFLLDALDREDALEADASIGLNNSYLFAEWYVSQLDGFGSDDRLEVGTNTWMLGLAFEF